MTPSGNCIIRMEGSSLEQFRNRLRLAIDAEIERDTNIGSLTGWGRKMGFSASTLSGLLKATTPQFKILSRIAAETGISLNWLLSGKGPMRVMESETAHNPIQIAEPPIEYLARREYVMVPSYNFPTNVGIGHSIESDQVVDHLAFKKDWIVLMGLAADRLALISVKGDSMEPTLKESDLVLLDLRDQKVRNDAIYVLRLERDLIVKRLQRSFDDTIFIKSDNPAYEKLVLAGSQAHRLGIIGRVVWTGRRL